MNIIEERRDCIKCDHYETRSIDILEPIGAMMVMGNSLTWTDNTWFNQPVTTPQIRKNQVLSITFIDTNVTSPPTVFIKFWDATDMSVDNPTRDTHKVNIWAIQNGTNFDIIIGGYGGVTIMSTVSLFANFVALTTLDLSIFDTLNVTNMSQMFNMCQALTSLDLSNFDTSKVTDMSFMFNNCWTLTTLDLSNFDTSNVENMMGTFQGCRSFTSIDLSSFDTFKVTNMDQMFNNFQALTSLDISTFRTDIVSVNMDNIFLNRNNSLVLQVENNSSTPTTMYDRISALPAEQRPPTIQGVPWKAPVVKPRT